jgi:hypothetical protein
MSSRSLLAAARAIRRPFLSVPLALGAVIVVAGTSGSAQASTGQAATAARAAAASSPRQLTAAARNAPAAAGTWKLLPAVRVTRQLENLVSVWTGHEMIIHGTFGTYPTRGRVTLAYRPATNTWKRLARGPAWMALETGDVAVWTGSRMLIFGQTNGSYNPAANTWRAIPGPGGPSSSVLGWTGHQVIMWIEGCCGGTSKTGSAYNPKTSTWKSLPASPLQSRVGVMGAWTGKELLVVGGFGGEFKPGTYFRNGAAYNPVTRTWRKIAPMPAAHERATAVWDGKEVLFIGGHRSGTTQLASHGLAYNPATNHWRWLPNMPYLRSGFAAVWAGHQLLVWGGLTAANIPPPHGEAFNPVTNRWTALPPAPLRGRADPTAVWTGRHLIVWGGYTPGDGTPPKDFTDGAAYTP